MARTVRVAILGGGMGGVAAAWALAHDTTPGVTYDVTVYEASWRLGGKCASGRNAGQGNRIEEHGIHILMGFYSQVLRILRDCYAEVDPALGFGPFSKALEAGDELQLPDLVDGAWDFWNIAFPTNTSKPGDADPNVRDFHGALAKAAETLVEWVEAYEAKREPAKTVGAALRATLPAGKTPGEILAGLVGMKPHLKDILGNPPSVEGLEISVRHLWMAIYFAATNLLGILEYGLVTPAAFQSPSLNLKDYKAWLESVSNPGPSPELTYDSPVVNAIYDLVFQQKVGFAAGVAVYDSLMMLLLYAGHLFYRMAGMGDVVFAPLYYALAAKGVHFRFQHTVTDVTLGAGSDGTPAVVGIQLTGDGKERTPAELFVTVHGKPCWPTAPLVNPPVGPITLGPADFDHVICAIPIGALASSVPSLAALAPIKRAIDGITTIPTESVQLWLDQPLSGLGWAGGRMMLGCFEEPFNSCGDMAQVIPVEDVPGEKAVLYMSDVYSGKASDSQADADKRVFDDAVAWTGRSLPKMLPGFDGSHLLAPPGAAGKDRVAAQYLRANVSGTELYVGSTPGTVALRLPADGAGVSNLFLASDWVVTEENAGCVEGAARSGVQAAAALTLRASLPVYRQYDDDWVFPGPVLLRGVNARAFPFLADPAALATLCASHSTGKATVQPWSIPLVLVFAAASDDITSTDPAYADFGRLAEREVGVFVPVRVTDANGVAFTALLCPYLFVDNGATLLAGREIYGIPKELATFPAWDFDAPVPLPLTITGLAIPSRGDLASQQPILTLTELVRSPFHLSVDLGDTLRTLWREILAADATVPLVALKQFHSIQTGNLACYQALVRCSIVPDVTSVSLDAGIWSVDFPSRFFPDPAGTLGLPSDAHTILSLEATLDFTLTLGSVVPS
ncbi:MAG TPA: FAD-dependent oxidoreductase [Polyangiaceae bacterium]|jgi:uncharacterized protein with NAD-binding domain and iron-sulfur cluster